MIESLVQISVGCVIALGVLRSLMTGTTYVWLKAFERNEHPLVYWAWVALGALVSAASGYYGIEGLL